MEFGMAGLISKNLTGW